MTLPYYPIITGPISPYSNVAVNPEYFKPSQYFISAISLGKITTITTTASHNYVIGQLCRLLIPSINGSYQLNERKGYVINIPSATQVVLDLDSSASSTFIITTQPTQPQILAIGDISSGNINNSGNLNVSTLIPGSYQNISPL